MSAHSVIAWVQRLALQDEGYSFAIPALLAIESVFSLAVIRKISLTEIDFQTYLGQAALFLDGERDYSKLDPAGGSGPCVYPAGHIYFYLLLHRLTDGGVEIIRAQYVFAGLLVATTLTVALLYRQAGAPPILTLSLVLSKRIHSIFLLRLFNDPVAMLLVYASLYLTVKGWWKVSSIVLSLGLAVKMNVLLFLPGLLVASFIQTGLVGAVSYISSIALVQVLVSLPFTLHHPDAYVANAFDFSRAFLYEWTVNWRFISESTFASTNFAQVLLSIHLSLLVSFGLYKWSKIGISGPQWLLQLPRRGLRQFDKTGAAGVLSIVFTSNMIGILCARSLHYQFYSWYFHQVPLLLWFSNLPMMLKLAVPLCLEWCWNVFPSTKDSSLAVLACHVVLIAGACTAPTLTTLTCTAAPVSEADEGEVETLLSDQTAVVARTKAAREEAAARLAEAQAREREREAKELASFQKRMAIRRAIISAAGRLVILLRTLLVVAAIGLLFTVVHPYSPVSKGTYVDENALQPGQSRVYWDYFDVTYADMLSEKVARLGSINSSNSSEERAEFVRSELASYGLSARTQSYHYGKADDRLLGVNAYARSATPRIDGREAVILTASWQSQLFDNSSNTIRQTNVRGIASLLALARYLSTQAHLSKDLIFVVSDGYLEGINVWTSTYFGSHMADVYADPISIGGSHVWNAISLDYPSDSFSALVVQYEGINGQLPNMDVVNTLVRVAERVAPGVPTLLADDKDEDLVLLKTARRIAEYLRMPMRPDVERELTRYEQGAHAAARQAGFGAAGRASGPHALFQRFHVDAITIFAVPAEGPFGFYHMGRVVESFVRSMSNLLERLHHSQFFYLLLTPYRFVPIGVVILIPLMLSIAMTITGLQVWFQEETVSKQAREKFFSASSQVMAGQVDDAQPESPTLAWYRDQLHKHWRRKQDDADAWETLRLFSEALTKTMRPYQNALVAVSASIFAGVVTLLWLSTLSYDALTSLPHREHTWIGIVTSLAVSYIVSELVKQVGAPAVRVGKLMLSFAYIQAGIAVALLSVLNFSLATVYAFTLGLALFFSHTTTSATQQSRWTVAVRLILLQALNPIVWLSVSRLPSVHVAADLAEQLLEDWFVLGSNTVPIVCTVYLPLLLQLQTSLLLSMSHTVE